MSRGNFWRRTLQIKLTLNLRYARYALMAASFGLIVAIIFRVL